jgi:hypothetical protein
LITGALLNALHTELDETKDSELDGSA